MAFAASAVWEVRTTGSDANGGGFDPVSGTPGTDYSQQAAAQVAYTDLVIDATTNTNCTSAGHPFTSAHVGNVINITAGTGFTVQRVQVMSVAGGVATCDKSLGTLSSTGGTGNLGGALLMLAKAAALYVNGNTIWMALGTYSSTSAIAWTGGFVLLQGYDQTRGDNTGNRPLITTATNSINLMTLNNVTSMTIRNLKFTSTAGTKGKSLTGVTTASNHISLDNCVFDGATTHVDGSSRTMTPMSISRCAFLNFSTAAILDPVILYLDSVLFSGTGRSIDNTAAGTLTLSLNRCIFAGGTAGIYDPATTRLQIYQIRNCTFENQSSYGITCTATSGSGGSLTLLLFNNIFYGITTAAVNVPNDTQVNNNLLGNANNAYGGNGADRVGLAAGQGDLALTADPLTNYAGGDYSLNTVVGGGAVLRGAGFPGLYPGSSTTGYPDVGAVQHQDPPTVVGRRGGLSLAGR